MNQTSANVVLGVGNMNSTGSYNQPHGVWSNGTVLYVADAYNNRVLIWNSIPTTNNPPANLVLGEPYMTTYTTDYGGSVSASNFNEVEWVYSDGTRVYAADENNNRVLIWNTMPTSNMAPANLALGQPDLTSSAVNNGGGVSATEMNLGHVPYYDGTRLFVTDTSNNRILVWNSIPTASGTPASGVLGQGGPDLPRIRPHRTKSERASRRLSAMAP